METIKLHYFQKDLLKKLTLSEGTLRFNELLIDGLESEHMNYHLQKLVDLDFVTKTEQGYLLTDKGKDYSNLMDDNIDIVEKQPKTSVLIVACRFREGTNEAEFLVNKRLRQPYYGKVGLLTGKVHFGETMEEAVKRELFEESGLSAGKVKLLSVYRKIRTKGDEIVQDVLFYRHFATEITGELITKTVFQENFWGTAAELEKRNDRYDTFQLKEFSEYENHALSYTEDKAEAKDF